MADFDVKQLSTYEWLGIGGGALAFINSFLPWLSFGEGIYSGSVGAWSLGFFGSVSVLCLVAAAVIVVLPHFGVSMPQVPMIWLGLAGAAAVFTLLAWLTYSGFGVGPSIGVFLGLALAIASAAGGYLTYKQSTSDKAA